MRSILNKISEFFLRALFPKQCILCNAGNALLCKKCEAKLMISNSPLPSWIKSRYAYKDDDVRKIIFKIKYNHTPELATEMGEYCRAHINLKDTLLIPIPISEKRNKQRGYNQALYIARGISENQTVDALERVRDTKKLFQTRHRDNRADEIKDSFQIKTLYKDFIKDKNILIIDDITTTGVTLYEARNILLKNGARSVCAFTIAH